MDYSQKDAAERQRDIDAARRWAENTGKNSRDGFPEWCGNTGRAGGHAAAHAEWMSSPARIERWAERSGIFVGRGFARWYLAEGRTDTFAEAYEVYRVMLNAEIEADRKRRAGA